jgi:hypothetical protein
LKAFTKHIFNGKTRPIIGKIKDWYMKFKWQEHGVVHVHMLIWSILGADIEVLLQTSESLLTLAEIIDIYITTLFPRELASSVPSNNIKSNEEQSEQKEFYAGSTLKNQASDSNSINTINLVLLSAFKNTLLPFYHHCCLYYTKKHKTTSITYTI